MGYKLLFKKRWSLVGEYVDIYVVGMGPKAGFKERIGYIDCVGGDTNMNIVYLNKSRYMMWLHKGLPVNKKLLKMLEIR